MRIEISVDDQPIEVAKKLITATYIRDASPMEKSMRASFGIKAPEIVQEDFFSIDDLEEIAGYLILYCSKHRED